MTGDCSRNSCYDDLRCPVGHTHKKDCSHWKSGKTESNTKEEFDVPEGNSHLLSWSGSSMGMDDINVLTERTNSMLFGSIGEANSGKTTFLGLLYLLLNDGQFIKDWNFSNSYSILGWEYIANYLRYQSGNKSEFPPHTSSFGGRDVGLLHLGLLNNQSLFDLMFTDVPGEWFTNWSSDVSGTGTGNANWIHENSRGFFLFIDCEALVNEPGKYRLKTRALINRLLNDLKGRPVAIIWSKADLFSEIKDSIKRIISNEIGKIPIKKEFQVSIHHGKGNSYHKNILKSVAWLLEKIISKKESTVFEFSSSKSDDFFISYRGEL
ncbi:hypothetical protein [Dokdonia sp.]|uniref:TRAFAC clade GTPase domain-containing protein n=1 Tax=Dokdonia sp. TaxID=2024995 RepID=UPI00326420F1